MNKLSGKLFMASALLLAVSCDDISGASQKDASAITNTPTETSPRSAVKVDTLCVYEHLKGPSETRVFKSNTHLISFLDSTGYNENDINRTIKKMEHQPDFTKWNYFAVAGLLDWRNTPKINISEGKNMIIINYIRLIPPPPLDSGCPMYAPPISLDYLYSIPSVGKEIKFTETTELFKCSCGRDH